MAEHTEDYLAAPSLADAQVRLELLSYAHAAGLLKHGNDIAIYRYLPCAPLTTAQRVEAFIERALCEYRAGQRIPYAIVEVASGEAVGSSSFLALREQHRSLEIGWTWLGAACQRTGVNTRCKLLLLTHAFERKKCIRVEFKTDLRNHKSQCAIERIGAQREGVFRNHMICADGSLRDSVYYSITREEWPQVRTKLLDKLR